MSYLHHLAATPLSRTVAALTISNRASTEATFQLRALLGLSVIGLTKHDINQAQGVHGGALLGITAVQARSCRPGVLWAPIAPLEALPRPLANLAPSADA